MKAILLSALLFAPMHGDKPSSLHIPLTSIEQRDLSCVATFAVIASRQEQGDEIALVYPLLTERGQTYAGLVGERVVRRSGQTLAQVREQILNSVEALQKSNQNQSVSDGTIAEKMEQCLPLLDLEIPAKPAPTLNQCAALMQMAYEEVHVQEGLSKKAQDIKTLAFVLENRAREKMMAEGLSGTERDIKLMESRQSLQNSAAPQLDTDLCFTYAAPEQQEGPHG